MKGIEWAHRDLNTGPPDLSWTDSIISRALHQAKLWAQLFIEEDIYYLNKYRKKSVQIMFGNPFPVELPSGGHPFAW